MVTFFMGNSSFGLAIIGETGQMARLGQDKAFYLSTTELGIQAGKTLHRFTLVYCEWSQEDSALYTGDPGEPELCSTPQFAPDRWGNVHVVK
jgi:hypothetical protein